MKFPLSIVVLLGCLAGGVTGWAAENNLAIITVTNDLPAARAAATVEVAWPDLRAVAAIDDQDLIEVRDLADDKLLVSQNIDLNGDGRADQLVFQADLGPGEAHTFAVRAALISMRVRFENMAKVYGRFVPERFDDFAWENDKIAFRTYGPALITSKTDALTSSGIDVWCKSVPKLVVNEWYWNDDYHEDHGEGADFYKVGPSRGCGGTGVWDGKELITSKNFKSWKVVANGPVRLIFELTYEPWQAGGYMVSEVKRITLDAGTYLNRYDSTFTADNGVTEIPVAIGLSKTPDGKTASDRSAGWLAYWETTVLHDKPHGELGIAVVTAPAAFGGTLETADENLVLIKAVSGKPVTFYAGAGWTRRGEIADFDGWRAYLTRTARALGSPLVVSVGAP